MRSNKIRYNLGLIIILSLILLPGTVSSNSKRILKVTATAYSSTVGQTDSTPTLAAWNNRLKPGMKVIAVSRDLLKMGLTNGTKVRIAGLSGVYTVRDKMNKRWTKKIDLYMGNDLQAAKNWGNRKVVIQW